MKARDHLEAIFSADRAADEAEAHLLGTPDTPALVDLLADTTRAALDAADRRDAGRRLVRLSDLCAQVPGPRMVDTLVAIMDDPDPSVRVAAGEAMADVACDRYAEGAAAIERAIEEPREGLAMRELPWLVAEIAEPGAVSLISRFTRHPEAEVVAAAVESLASLGDPSAMEVLDELRDDARTVTLDDLGEESSVTLGELVREAMDELRPATERGR